MESGLETGSVHARDLDADGDPDLVMLRQIASEIVWHENTGAGSFGSAQRLASLGADSAEGILVEDLDGDGDPDLVSYQDAGAGQLSWLEHGEMASFGPAERLLSAGFPEALIAEDLDGDADLDFVGVVWDEATSSAALLRLEQVGRADPLDPDTDGDGLLDGDEVELHGTDPRRADSDGDGLPDPLELQTYGTDPIRADSDADGLLDGEELVFGTDPRAADTDGDGLTDGDELRDDSDPLDPNDPAGTVPVPEPGSALGLLAGLALLRRLAEGRPSVRHRDIIRLTRMRP